MEERKNARVWALAAAALLFLFGSFGMGGYGMTGLGMGFGFFFMLLFWGVIIWLVFTLINAAQSGKKEEYPSTILKKRYASGKYQKSSMRK